MSAMNLERIGDTGGAGPAIVMVHGWGQTRRALEPLAERLQDRFRVVTFDLAGHGAARDEPGPHRFARHCRDAAAVVERLGLRRFHLLGWSMGGTIAALYVIDRAGPPPASLILLSSTPRFVAPGRNLGVGQSPAAVKKMAMQIKAGHDAGLRGFIDLFFESGEIIDTAMKHDIETALIPETFPPDKEALLDTLEELAETDLTAKSSDFEGSVLLIHGSLDKICPSGCLTLWKGRFGHVTTATLEGAGHAPHLTRGREVARHITQFISDRE